MPANFFDAAQPVLSRLTAPELRTSTMPGSFLADLYRGELIRLGSKAHVERCVEQYLLQPMAGWHDLSDIPRHLLTQWRQLVTLFPIIARGRNNIRGIQDESVEGILLGLEVNFQSSRFGNWADFAALDERFLAVWYPFCDRANLVEAVPDYYLLLDVSHAILMGAQYLKNLPYVNNTLVTKNLVTPTLCEEYKLYFTFLADVLLPEVVSL